MNYIKMKYKEILKLLFFSIFTAFVSRYIAVSVIWESMKITKEKFHKKLINIDTYQQKAVESLYLQVAIMFILPFVAAIVFYFFAKINLRSKYNFLMFMALFTILFFSSYILIGRSSHFF